MTADVIKSKSNPAFFLSGKGLTISAQNGALVQEVYLTVCSTEGKFILGKGGAVSLSDDGEGNISYQKSDVAASPGQVSKKDGVYAVTDINAASVNIRSTDTDAQDREFSAIKVISSIPLTKQEIIDGINEKGAAFKAEMESYKA